MTPTPEIDPVAARQVVVRLEPEGREIRFDRINTVLQLLNKLQLRATDALVIRDGGLLTQDVWVRPGDHLTVRCVMSTG
ncbi:MAG: hypothetical protein AB7E47_18110 [Desulfovibrionaceae bacterium]